MPIRPGRIESGDPIPAEWLRTLSRAVVQRITGVAPIRVAHTGNSVSISTSSRASGRAIVDVKVTAIQDDYLECTRYTPGETTAGGSIEVARAYMLRRTPFDGSTITYENGQAVAYTYATGRSRTADDGTTSETQVLTPDYWIGEILTAVGGPTGVTYEKTVDGATATVEVLYSDITPSGRYWAKVT
jgi:hypothetical protein